jgi:hypothetical protein
MNLCNPQNKNVSTFIIVEGLQMINLSNNTPVKSGAAGSLDLQRTTFHQENDVDTAIKAYYPNHHSFTSCSFASLHLSKASSDRDIDTQKPTCE